jgi:hypothetical protein
MNTEERNAGFEVDKLAQHMAEVNRKSLTSKRLRK